MESVRTYLSVIDPSWETVEAAAAIKAGGGLSFADAFCIATAAQLDLPLLTGDPEIAERGARHGCRVVDLR